MSTQETPVLGEISYPPTAEEVQMVGIILAEAIIEYGHAKLAEARAKSRWESWFNDAYHTGAIAGKNDALRMGEAVELNPDLRIEYLDAVEEAKVLEYAMKVVQVQDKTMGRLLLLASIQSSVRRDSWVEQPPEEMESPPPPYEDPSLTNSHRGMD